jgi:outer membrane receptor protein involved in Fe transport
MKAFRNLTIALAVFALGTGIALAQVSATTGAISGTAADETGAVLPGVTVTATSPQMQGQQVTYTDAGGSYRIPAIPPGTYTVVFELPGFTTYVREEISIGLGFMANIDAELRVATLEETVTVTGASPVVDVASTKTATNFDAAKLANLPGARDFWAILANSPSVQMSRIDVGASRAGTQTGYAAYDTKMTQHRPMVEGMVMTEGRGGACFYYDFGSMDEVSIGTGTHSADMGWPGVVSQFIAKSGGNEYHGTARADYQCGDWQRTNITQEQIDLGVKGGESVEAKNVNKFFRYWDFNADVGGYFVKDKLWVYGSAREWDIRGYRANFPVKPFRTHLNNLSGKATYSINQDNKAIFYTMYGRKNQVNRTNTHRLSSSSAIHRSTDSTWNQLYWGSVTKGEWNSVLSDRAFFEIRGGKMGYDWPNFSYAPDKPTYEDVGNNEVSGGNRNWQRDRHRAQVLTSLTYFQDGWGGDHNFKFGGEFFREIRRDHRGGLSRNPGGRNTGGYLYNDMFHILDNGVPSEIYLFETPTTNDSRLWTYSFYASDSWAVNEHLTMNLGGRYDKYRSYLPAQSHGVGRIHCFTQACQDGGVDFAARDVMTWNVFAPRIGVTYDVAGDGRTVIKANYGVYWWNPSGDLANLVNANSPEWYRRHEWNDTNGDGLWQAGEEGEINSQGGGSVNNELDPNIEDSRTRELAFWIERELIPNFGVRGGYVYRKLDKFYQKGNNLRTMASFNIDHSVTDPGVDGVAGTGDDQTIAMFDLDEGVKALGNAYTTRNLPAEPEFHTFEASGTKRMANNWSLIGGVSYRLSRDHDNNYFGNTIRGGEGAPENPNECINTDDADCRFHFTTWTFKLNGTWNAPGGWIVSPNLRHQAGQPFGRIYRPKLNYGSQRVLTESMSSNRQDHITVMDLRTEKAFNVGSNDGGRLIGFFDIYNLTNSNAAENINANTGGSYLRPIEILNPTIVRFGIKLEW